MSLYEQWKDLANMQQTQQAQAAFWSEYFNAETENYKKILANKDTVFSGKLSELAKEFGMTDVVFAGFMDGINESLKEGYALDSLTEESEISLNVDFEKLYANMLEAKAPWLYNLDEWNNVFSKEKRQEITKQYHLSKQAVSNKIEKNAPCPCGSGKKYK